MTVLVNVGEINPKCAGRYKGTHPGELSGEELRDDYIIPAISTNEKVEVDLSGAVRLSYPFVEEAFAGLVRKMQLSADILESRMSILGDSSDEIWEMIRTTSKIQQLG